MKERLLALLRTKFDGVQDAILRRIAEAKSKGLSETATDEDIQGIVDGLTVQAVIEDYANSRVNEAARTAIQNYEKKYGLKEGKPGTQPQDQPPQEEIPTDAPDWAKAILKQNQELTQKIAGLETKEKTQSLVDKVHAKLTSGDKKVPKSFLKSQSIQIESEDEVDAVADKIFQDFSAVRTELISEGIISEEPKMSLGGSKTQVEKDIEDWAKND